MKKIIILCLWFVVTGVSCAHRGMDLDDQIPERFLESAQTRTPDGFSLLGVMGEDATMKEENIDFLNEEQRLRFLKVQGSEFYYQAADASGNLQQMNPSLKQEAGTNYVSSGGNSEKYSGFSFVNVSSGSKGLLIKSFSNKQFSWSNELGILAH